MGAIRIVGARIIPHDQLVRRLTEPSPPPGSVIRTPLSLGGSSHSSHTAGTSWRFGMTREPDALGTSYVDKTGKPVTLEEPIWTPGTPAAFSEPSRKDLARRLRGVLADLGLLFGAVEVKVVPDTHTGTADLIVTLDEGLQIVIDKIAVTGNTRDTLDEVLRYLELAPGMPLSGSLVSAAELKLWRSARCRHHRVTAQRSDPRSPKATLDIELRERDSAPPLSEALTPAESALLNLVDWLADVGTRQDDVVVTVTDTTQGVEMFQLVLSPTGVVGLSKSRRCGWPRAPAARRRAVAGPPGPVLAGRRAQARRHPARGRAVGAAFGAAVSRPLTIPRTNSRSAWASSSAPDPPGKREHAHGT